MYHVACFGFFLQRFTIIFFRGKNTITEGVIFFMISLSLMELSEPQSLFLLGFVTLMIYRSLVRLITKYDADRVPNWNIIRHKRWTKVIED